MSQNEILLKLGTAKVEMTMAQAKIFGCELLTLAPRDGNCRSFGRGEKSQACRLKLDVTRRDVGIAHLFRSRRQHCR